MKNFFYVLFGGLCAIGCGVAVAYGGSVAWKFAMHRIDGLETISLSRAVSAISEEVSASTVLAGLKRTVIFSAHDEEDVIDAAARALPYAADGKITADAYIIKNLTVGGSAIEHNTDKLVPIASVTKLVTAVVARRLINANERISITGDIIDTYGNTGGFKTGETFRAGDLLYPLLMVSSNDSAEAFAHSYGRTQFIKAMNDFAQEIGAYRTYFADPSGLSALNVSTANDLLVIIDWIRKNDPTIIDITTLKAKTIRTHTWINPTHFLSWSYYVGGKNGYTPEADRTAVSLFEMGANKNLYAVVVLGSASRDADVVKLLEKVGE